MRSTKFPFLALSVLLFVAACSSPTSNSNGISSPVVSSPNVDRFVTILSDANDGDSYVFRSVAEIVSAADVVVAARISGIEKGRSFVGDDGRVVLRTGLIELNGVTVLAGNKALLAGDFKVEVFMVGEDSLGEIARVLPRDQEAVFFLSDFTENRNTTLDGVEGRTYLFPFQQGFLMESGGELVSVLGGLVAPSGLKDLASVVDMVRSVVRSGEG